ncbi:MAG TPA: hypothetical protein QF556_03845 [Rhodospirillales bacterium]|nr:hypothetical protein [Rhodospirillaceae bacterium]HIJ93542.1 hypothetical protein [Rhodospirillaceae bacterium]HJP53823.1 hypothetical protein [Rhodospirillales bacterium]
MSLQEPTTEHQRHLTLNKRLPIQCGEYPYSVTKPKREVKGRTKMTSADTLPWINARAKRAGYLSNGINGFRQWRQRRKNCCAVSAETLKKSSSGNSGKSVRYTVEPAIPIGGIQGRAGFAGRRQEGEPRAPPPDSEEWPFLSLERIIIGSP